MMPLTKNPKPQSALIQGFCPVDWSIQWPLWIIQTRSAHDIDVAVVQFLSVSENWPFRSTVGFSSWSDTCMRNLVALNRSRSKGVYCVLPTLIMIAISELGYYGITYSSPYHQYLPCFYSLWLIELLQNVDHARQFSSESQVCPNWFSKYWRAMQRFSLLKQWWRNSICGEIQFVKVGGSSCSLLRLYYFVHVSRLYYILWTPSKTQICFAVFNPASYSQMVWTPNPAHACTSSCV